MGEQFDFPFTEDSLVASKAISVGMCDGSVNGTYWFDDQVCVSWAC
jgi:hypothetical protein